MAALNVSAQINAQTRTAIIKAMFAMKFLELAYGHQGHLCGSQLAAAGAEGEGGGDASFVVAIGGDKCMLNSAIATAVSAPTEGKFFLLHRNQDHGLGQMAYTFEEYLAQVVGNGIERPRPDGSLWSGKSRKRSH